MKKNIEKVAVLGSGTMGAQIACHFANIGLKVLLLDMAPAELTEEEKKKGLSLKDEAVRNRIVNNNLKRILKINPAPLYRREYKSHITTGNFADDMPKIKDADWILEAVVEKKDIKQSLFEAVEAYRAKDAIVTTNTSGIPINELAAGRSESFQKHFCGTHFFNPPRYLQLLEIIPSEKTDGQVVQFLEYFGDLRLGKTTVICKDTPAFIGNRIGLYAIMLTIELMREMELTIKEVDVLTGRFMGRPKTATFRTCDLVGIDIIADVAKGIYENCPDDEERDIFKIPPFMKKMLDKDWLGEKTRSGFYKKIKEDGQSKILQLNIDKMEYEPEGSPKFLIFEEVKQKSTVEEKLKTYAKGKAGSVNILKKVWIGITGEDSDKAVAFFHKFFYRLFAYCSHRVPEITDSFYKIDYAIRDGFNWEMGPFEVWDVLGLKETALAMKEAGHPPADWVFDMIDSGAGSFYKVSEGNWYYFDGVKNGDSYRKVPGTGHLIFLDNYRKDHTVWSNDSCNIIHIGDGVLNVEFTSRGNTIDLDVMQGIHKALDLAESEEEYKAVVIGNEGNDFSLGANLVMIGINAYKGNYDAVADAVDQFQKMTQRIRYAAVPVVAAPRGKALGGGTEICLHSDSVQATAETYMGLVEVGVGLVPAGGGTKEMALRAAQRYISGDPKTPHLQKNTLTIAEAKVAKSAYEAFDLNYLRSGIDNVTMNKHRLLANAKEEALRLAHRGYAPPPKSTFTVLGRNALSFFYTAIQNQFHGDYISEYDREILRKLAYILCGGDLSGEQKVSADYMLKLEKDTFMELVKNKKTQKRIEHMLKKGKPLRN